MGKRLRVRRLLGGLIILGGLGTMPLWAQGDKPVAALRDAAGAMILTREQAAAVMPPSVFYRGQTAAIQARNASGLKLEGGRMVLMALVDTSGYTSAVAQSYQGYLISEVPLRFADQVLAPGAYGFGFVAGERMVVMDLGGNEVLRAATTRDAEMKRPVPLQIVPPQRKAEAGGGGSFRLYLGRSYVVLTPAAPRGQ